MKDKLFLFKLGYLANIFVGNKHCHRKITGFVVNITLDLACKNENFWKTCISYYEPNIYPLIREFYDEIGDDINKHCLFYTIN